MKAMVMTAAGPPEVLELQQIAPPRLDAGSSDVLVRVHAAAINPADYKRRKSGAGVKLPAVLGFDGAGVVEKVGSRASRLKPGDAVYFLQNGLGTGPGCYAEYTVLHEDYLAHKPKSLSMVEAAAVPLVLVTMWEALFERAQLHAGESVLIHAGAGGTGHVGIQLAKHAGARVATTVSNPEKAAWVRELGADHVIDYRSEDFAAAALRWTDGKGADVVIDTVGGDTLCKSFGAAKVYGRVVTLLDLACAQADMTVARTRNLTLGYTLMLTPMMLGLHDAWVGQRIMLEKAADMIDAGGLKVKVSHSLPLEQAREAHRLIEAGHTSGKIVLQLT